jgi:hypothetical protein
LKKWRGNEYLTRPKKINLVDNELEFGPILTPEA